MEYSNKQIYEIKHLAILTIQVYSVFFFLADFIAVNQQQKSPNYSNICFHMIDFFFIFNDSQGRQKIFFLIKIHFSILVILLNTHAKKSQNLFCFYYTFPILKLFCLLNNIILFTFTSSFLKSVSKNPCPIMQWNSNVC